ncbi:hypothetical protein DSO57_1025399 [Entomophthora muscae]|uniref:Uncharacterized protein n=1 Tax=Entomophthora muscae TaxID=34485 RepID=A0ACC2RTB2_9FUNG|nr:hypothetical protein DSO57_1025399 [Entomophthora muscae]
MLDCCQPPPDLVDSKFGQQFPLHLGLEKLPFWVSPFGNFFIWRVGWGTGWQQASRQPWRTACRRACTKQLSDASVVRNIPDKGLCFVPWHDMDLIVSHSVINLTEDLHTYKRVNQVVNQRQGVLVFDHHLV